MKLILKSSVSEKIRAYTHLCPEEISGLGKIEIVKGEMIVTDVEIFEQMVSGAHSTIKPEDLAKFQTKIVKAGGSMKQWYLWWHSHANMSVFFSGIDTGTIDSSTEFPWLVSLVVNKKDESKARLDIFNPVRVTVDLDVRVEEGEESEEVKRLREELEEALSESKKEIEDVCQQEINEKVTGSNQEHTGFKEWGGYWEPDEREIRREYWGHKIFLIRQIEILKNGGQSKSQALQLQTEALAEHMAWGKSLGIEVARW